MTDNIHIPTTCKECFKGPFQLPRPQCWYEKAYHLQKSVDFFKNELKMDLHMDVNAILAKIKPRAKKCLSECPKRAEAIIRQMQFDQMQKMVVKLGEEIKGIKRLSEEAHIKNVDDPILRQEHDLESPIHEVNRQDTMPVMGEPDPPSGVKLTFERTPVLTKKKPVGGWLKYQRNVKKSNITKYLDKLEAAHPDLAGEIEKVKRGSNSDVVRIGTNTKGNAMIEYRELGSTTHI